MQCKVVHKKIGITVALQLSLAKVKLIIFNWNNRRMELQENGITGGFK
jgi:hypothetical protein